jgi:hypothetical protein
VDREGEKYTPEIHVDERSEKRMTRFPFSKYVLACLK